MILICIFYIMSHILHFVHSNGREAEISGDIITEIYLL